MPNLHVLEVWGDLACFSRPEMKVERFSYPIITPSAARGIFDAVFSKPHRDPTRAQFRWQVRKIEVLSPPTYIALRRNEVKDKTPLPAVLKWLKGASVEPLWADGNADSLGTDQKGRTQRQTMALRNVHYRLHAEIRTWPGFGDKLVAFDAQFKRRAESGKCFQQPYFGCREFPAYFQLVDSEAACEHPPPVDELNMDVGLMLYDVFDLSRPGTCYDGPSISLFRAVIRGGVLDVPAYESADVLKPAQAGDTDA